MIRFRLATCLLAATHAWALDLTPTAAYRELEGVKIPVLEFADSSKKFSYQPPGGWRVSGGGSAVQFDAPGFGQNAMKLMVINKPPGTAAGAELASATVMAIARALLPKTAENAVVAKETPSPFTLEGRPSLELTLSYVLSSAPERLSVAAVDRSETEWFVMAVFASEREFDTVHAQAISSMFSWRVVRQ